MSKTIWKKDLGGSLKIYQQERSQYLQMQFYISPNYFINGKHKKNGMFVKSLKPITTKLEAEREAKKIFREFDMEKHSFNPQITTFHDVAILAFELRKKTYKLKERGKLEHNPTFVSSAIKEWNRYEKEIKPVFGKLDMKDRDTLQNTIFDFVDHLTTHGSTSGKTLSPNTIARYLIIIGMVQKHAIFLGLMPSVCTNPPIERRSNERPAYRMLELKKITDQIMIEYQATQDLFFLELHDYMQFLIASPTRYGMETIILKKQDMRLFQNKEGIRILHITAEQTKRGRHSYETSPEFLDKYGQRFLEKYESLKDNDYVWFTNTDKSRATVQERVRKNFVRISKKLGLYYFNNHQRPMTSIRHASMQRMNREGVQDIHIIHNTSKVMTDTHYLAEHDERSIIERHDKIYAKRLKSIK